MYLSLLQIQPIVALHVILNRSEVEVFWGALEQLHGSFRDIGAHQDFQMPEFIMPAQLIKGLWD